MATSEMPYRYNDIFAAELMQCFGSRVLSDEPMAPHTTFGVGGPADLFLEAVSVDDMVSAVNLCEEHGIDYFVLGGGSNILVSDEGYRGMVLKSGIDHIRCDGREVAVGSGHSLDEFIAEVCALGLGGAEMLSGIKGSIGGAVYGNAGAYGGWISDCLVSASILRPGGMPRLEDRKYFQFSYRNSILKRTHEIVLEANFRFKNGSAEDLQSKRQEILRSREKRLPKTDCSAGCFFKNIEKPDEEYGKLSTGVLLEQVGAKELVIGGAGVYKDHANILVNLGGAKADDIKELAMKLKRRVKERFGYNLIEEITYLGNFN